MRFLYQQIELIDTYAYCIIKSLQHDTIIMIQIYLKYLKYNVSESRIVRNCAYDIIWIPMLHNSSYNLFRFVYFLPKYIQIVQRQKTY